MDFSEGIDKYLRTLLDVMSHVDRRDINCLLEQVLAAYESDRMIFVCGNGGSGSTATHLAQDWNKGLGYGRQKRIKVLSLTDNAPIIMAYANDVNYDAVFVEQLKNFAKLDDLVIGISGSGNSKNVLDAVEYANGIGAVTFGLCGYDGGRLAKIARHAIVVPGDMQRAEDLHLIINHIVYRCLIDHVDKS